MPVLADALLEAGLPETVECWRCRGNGRIEMLEHCPVCPGDGRLPHPILAHLRLKRVKCEAVGPHHGDSCSGGRIQSPNAQFTRNCPTCQGTGFRTVETAHCRGCHVIDLLRDCNNT